VKNVLKWLSIFLITTAFGIAQEVGEVAVVPDDTTNSLDVAQEVEEETVVPDDTTNSLGVAQEVGEVAVVPDDTTKDPGLKPGDLAPSWALMYAPGKFEFLKNWTVERNQKLRKFMSQPNRYPMVLSFFATWCKPCMKELPHLENVYQAYKNEQVKFFLVDITEATRNNKGFEDSPKAGPFLDQKGITIPILYDNRGVAKERYGAKTLPRLFVIDKFQTIRDARQGFHEGEDLEGELSVLIDELMAEEE
jgi:thiol-disulfide isomerase/thioredoxin